MQRKGDDSFRGFGRGISAAGAGGPLRIDGATFVLDIVMDGRGTDHRRNRVARARFRRAGHETAERE